jgi:hypothetical protein
LKSFIAATSQPASAALASCRDTSTAVLLLGSTVMLCIRHRRAMVTVASNVHTLTGDT